MSRATRIAAAAAAALAMTAPPAGAVTITRADGVTPIARMQAIVDKAPMPTAPGVVRVRFGGTWGSTHYLPDERTIVVQAGVPLDDVTLWHELGHDYDWHALTDLGYQQWAAALGVTHGRTEYGPDPFGRFAPDGQPLTVATGREYFADFYAICGDRGRHVRDREDGHVTSGYGHWAPRLAVREACRRIWRFDAVR